jgi:NADPH-dependent 2,4-dienoyl-CoA reductase/sulfur reductase-like enzyme
VQAGDAGCDGMSEVVIVGAGPAGIAAAVSARQSGARVTLLDDNPGVGGQIWRGGQFGSVWFERLAGSKANVMTGVRVVSGDGAARTLLAERDGRAERFSYTKLILATGARELFLPFPGWTLPNVMGVGGLQALVKSGLPMAGKRVVVAGSGPLLLAVAAYLRKQGAVVPLIAEQASVGSLIRFTASLIAHPAKLTQAFALNPVFAGIRYLNGCWIETVTRSKQLQTVRLRQGARVWEEPCDFVANAYGFVPNMELAILLGCELQKSSVKVDSQQRTSIEHVYCAGETAGLGGVDTALVEGQIAGYAATDQTVEAAKLLPQWHKAKSFARRLNDAFRPRAELRNLAQPETIVCRCEDVPLARLRSADGWRSAKLHERCGMGPCQGRICGPAVEFILGWEPSSVRPPIFPTRLDTLIERDAQDGYGVERSVRRQGEFFSA